MEIEITFSSRLTPLPNGWKVIRLEDSGHYLAIGPDEIESPIHWDKWWIRRWIFIKDYERNK